MAIAVADLDGTIGIGLYRMADGTVFSVDVAASKARNVAYFSSSARTTADLTGVPLGTAVTKARLDSARSPTLSSGIDGTAAGPFFNIYQRDVTNPCRKDFRLAGPNQKWNRVFPGSAPLYRNRSARQRIWRERRRR